MITTVLDGNRILFRTQARVPGWLAEHGYTGGGVLAVHTGAGHPIRRWPDAHFDGVMRGLSVKPGLVVFIEDPGSAETRWDGPLPHVHWRGDLTSLKIILSNCDVFLGTDSGIMHMASAAGCEVVTVFGPTEPGWFGRSGTAIRLSTKMPCHVVHALTSASTAAPYACRVLTPAPS